MRLFAVAAVALAGCASEAPATCEGSYHLHVSVPAAEAGPVRSAFARWNALAGRDVARLEDGDPNDGMCAVRLDETTGDLGLWSPADGSIALSPERMRAEAPGCADRMSDCVEATVLHELGHGLGLKHVPGGVMAAGGELALEFGAADRTECARVGVCR